MLKIAICDNEKIICKEIRKHISDISSTYVVKEYNSGEELLNAKIQFDIIFMDIEMPSMNGLETVKKLHECGNESYIIFITSHIEMMAETFKVKAFRCIGKPIMEEDFEEAMIGAEREILDTATVLLKDKDKYIVIKVKDIIFIEAYGDGTYIHTKEDIYDSNKPLKEWNAKLGDEHFFQVHKSYIISNKYVKKITNKEVELLYQTDKIPIAKRRLCEFKKIIELYIKENARIV